ncbi:hypothetical protein RHMOL_Rhmol05G0317700 [Rhododendron molle]|uniref:Uncharacterized protein n=1 Tax=Rhododendron molle TaxID=49168 RepID=A0ACC0NWN7_RHOML|nr:hypothetical protein RHMOL_Rhmol05G0317700 [Rhododendron molle]
MGSGKLTILCLWVFLGVLVGIASAQLSTTFYSSSCPNVLATIKTAVNSAVSTEARMGASLLRLHFHDCFVNASTFHSLCLHCLGCDASVLLDGSTGEKSAGPNNNSLRGFDVIDTIKSQVENLCPGVVSCADILTVAARDSTVALGGPSWSVPLGRRDSTTASLSAANSNLPSPASSLSALITAFSNKGFTANEMVALSGSHTIGQSRCTVFRSRVYNETNIDSQFATSVQSKCPSAGGDDNLSPLDVTSPTSFDNAYFKNLQSQKGLLHSDQELFNGGSTDAQVNAYSTNSASFFTDFANAMVKMGNLSPLTGTSGQIRTNCRKTN